VLKFKQLLDGDTTRDTREKITWHVNKQNL